MEAGLPGTRIRPDILLEKDGRPSKLLEVVVTHEPEDHTREYARAAEMPLVIFEVETGDVLDNLLERTLAVHIENACLCGMCPRCGQAKTCHEGGHRWCRKCSACIEDPYDNHRHCRECGGVLLSRYWDSHYCCKVVKRYNLPPCPVAGLRTFKHSPGGVAGTRPPPLGRRSPSPVALRLAAATDGDVRPGSGVVL